MDRNNETKAQREWSLQPHEGTSETRTMEAAVRRRRRWFVSTPRRVRLKRRLPQLNVLAVRLAGFPTRVRLVFRDRRLGPPLRPASVFNPTRGASETPDRFATAIASHDAPTSTPRGYVSGERCHNRDRLRRSRRLQPHEGTSETVGSSLSTRLGRRASSSTPDG